MNVEEGSNSSSSISEVTLVSSTIQWAKATTYLTMRRSKITSRVLLLPKWYYLDVPFSFPLLLP